jgi:hypothetical protein
MCMCRNHLLICFFKKLHFAIRNVEKIKYIIWRSCFSFMRGAKSANSKLFKDFCNEAEMEKNKTDGILYFFIVPNQGLSLLQIFLNNDRFVPMAAGISARTHTCQ